MGSRRPRMTQTPNTTASTALTLHRESPATLPSVGAAPTPIVSAGFCRAVRIGASSPTPAVVAPLAQPTSTTPAPTAPSPTRYQVLPEQPPERIMPAPKSRPPTMLDTQRRGRRGISTSPSASITCTPTIATSRARR